MRFSKIIIEKDVFSLKGGAGELCPICGESEHNPKCVYEKLASNQLPNRKKRLEDVTRASDWFRQVGYKQIPNPSMNANVVDWMYNIVQRRIYMHLHRAMLSLATMQGDPLTRVKKVTSVEQMCEYDVRVRSAFSSVENALRFLFSMLSTTDTWGYVELNDANGNLISRQLDVNAPYAIAQYERSSRSVKKMQKVTERWNIVCVSNTFDRVLFTIAENHVEDGKFRVYTRGEFDLFSVFGVQGKESVWWLRDPRWGGARAQTKPQPGPCRVLVKSSPNRSEPEQVKWFVNGRSVESSWNRVDGNTIETTTEVDVDPSDETYVVVENGENRVSLPLVAVDSVQTESHKDSIVELEIELHQVDIHYYDLMKFISEDPTFRALFFIRDKRQEDYATGKANANLSVHVNMQYLMRQSGLPVADEEEFSQEHLDEYKCTFQHSGGSNLLTVTFTSMLKPCIPYLLQLYLHACSKAPHQGPYLADWVSPATFPSEEQTKRAYEQYIVDGMFQTSSTRNLQETPAPLIMTLEQSHLFEKQMPSRMMMLYPLGAAEGASAQARFQAAIESGCVFASTDEEHTPNVLFPRQKSRANRTSAIPRLYKHQGHHFLLTTHTGPVPAQHTQFVLFNASMVGIAYAFARMESPAGSYHLLESCRAAIVAYHKKPTTDAFAQKYPAHAANRDLVQQDVQAWVQGIRYLEQIALRAKVQTDVDEELVPMEGEQKEELLPEYRTHRVCDSARWFSLGSSEELAAHTQPCNMLVFYLKKQTYTPVRVGVPQVATFCSMLSALLFIHKQSSLDAFLEHFEQYPRSGFTVRIAMLEAWFGCTIGIVDLEFQNQEMPSCTVGNDLLLYFADKVLMRDPADRQARPTVMLARHSQVSLPTYDYSTMTLKRSAEYEPLLWDESRTNLVEGGAMIEGFDWNQVVGGESYAEKWIPYLRQIAWDPSPALCVLPISNMSNDPCIWMWYPGSTTSDSVRLVMRVHGQSVDVQGRLRALYVFFKQWDSLHKMKELAVLIPRKVMTPLGVPVWPLQLGAARTPEIVFSPVCSADHAPSAFFWLNPKQEQVELYSPVRISDRRLLTEWRDHVVAQAPSTQAGKTESQLMEDIVRSIRVQEHTASKWRMDPTVVSEVVQSIPSSIAQSIENIRAKRAIQSRPIPFASPHATSNRLDPHELPLDASVVPPLVFPTTSFAPSFIPPSHPDMQTLLTKWQHVSAHTLTYVDEEADISDEDDVAEEEELTDDNRIEFEYKALQLAPSHQVSHTHSIDMKWMESYPTKCWMYSTKTR